MREHFLIINEILCKTIGKDLNANTKSGVDNINLVLKAYNRFQEDERDGVDYIFDINNREDLKFLVEKCDLTASDIAKIYNDSQVNTTSLFFCHYNHDGIKMINNYEELVSILKSSLEEVVPCILQYVTRCREYQDIYEKYITEKIFSIFD